MVRTGYGRHKKVVTGTQDPTKQVSKNEWNDDHDTKGMFSVINTNVEQVLDNDVLTVIDSLTFVGAELGTTDTLARINNIETAAKDWVLLFPTAGDTITVTHTESPITAGQIHLADHQDRVLSANEGLLLIRIGDFWYEPLYPKAFLDSEFRILDEADRTKKLITSIGGNTTAKSATLAFACTDNRVYTYPDLTTVLAGLALAQTFAEYNTFTKGIRNAKAAITFSATPVFDFDLSEIQTMDVTGNITNTSTANRGDTRHKTVILKCDAITRTLAFNPSWVFVGTKPTQIAANKTAVLTLTCVGINETDVIAAYAVQA